MKTPRLSLTVQFVSASKQLPSRIQIKQWITSTLDCDAEMTLRIVDQTEAQSLNREFRNKDYATNVLTFPLDIDPMLMGDIVLCAPVVEQEARDQNKSLEAHYAHLIIHGTLHLMGYDHESDEEAEEMEALETQIVTHLGYADPYRI